MNKKHINMNDSFSVNDKIGPKGFVVIKDSKGKIIVKKENMIVQDGRNYIFNLFCAANGFGSNDMTGYKLKKVVFFESENEVKFTDTISNIPSTNISYTIGDANSTADLKYTNIDTENGISRHNSTESNSNYNYIKISKTLSFNSSDINYPPVLSSLAIIIGDNNDSSDKLFSRIVFDKIPVSAESELLLDYYIYF